MTDREMLMLILGKVQDYGEKVKGINGSCVFFDRNDNSTIVDHLIAHGVTVQKWIPATERLPEKEGRYLCVVRIGYRSGAVYVQIMNGDNHGFSLGHIYNDEVTHWMPLPEPPKE